MSDSQNIPEVAPQIPRHAVSIYGQGDAMDDFPVLKAFQQYVDAEHAKAQKRMTTLCIFFVILMVAVIGVFMMLLMSISQRNNSLSDQLFQFMLKDRDRQNVIVQSPAQQGDSAALLTLQKQLFDQQMKMMEEAMRPRIAQTASVPDLPVSQSERAEFTSQRLEYEKQAKADADRLKKAQAKLKAEREQIAKDKERLRQKEIELQRRNLYPEYYAAQESENVQPVRQSPVPAPVVQEPEDDYSELDAAIAAEERAAAAAAAVAEKAAAERNASPAASAPVAPAPATPTVQDVPPVRETPVIQEREDGSIRYFYDDDEDLDEFVNALELPTRESKPSGSSGWSMPID